MFADADHWLAQCERCLISKGDYNEPKTVQGSLVANQPWELLCIDFTKANIVKGVKRTSLFSQMPFPSTDRHLLPITKSLLPWPKFLWKNGLVCSEYLLGSIVIRVGLSTTKSFLISARCMASHGNSQCEHFNQTLFSLMRKLDQEQKPNWPVYLPSLVFAYNVTPHSTTGYKPYELMFGCKAPTPCNNWLGLKNYQPASFKSKTAWLNEQLNAMLYANKQALKGIHKSTKCNKHHSGSKDITIPVGNHVLLYDHLEGV